jgi:DNA polymerase
MTPFHLDLETTSASDLMSVGAYRYASDLSTRILMFAIAEGEGEPVLWDFIDHDGAESVRARTLLTEAVSSGATVYAHNYQFELALNHYRMAEDVGVTPPDRENYRCTQAMCRKAAIPESLAASSAFLGLDQQKEKVGKALIHIFSDQNIETTLFPPEGMIDPATVTPLKKGGFTKGKPPATRKSNSPVLDDVILWDWRVKVDGQLITVREAWETFKEYCRQDVRTEQELHRKLSIFELKGLDLASFLFDMRMNFRGAPFNRQALAHTQGMIEDYQVRLEANMTKLCGLRSSQGLKLTQWLKERGYPADNLQADTVEEVLTNPPKGMTPLALEVLRHRALLSFAAIKKIPTALACLCPDGRVRGTKVWHGTRTGRGASRLVQLDNVKKATIKDSKEAYEMICRGFDLSTFENLWDSPLEVFASCMRHFIQLPDGEMMLDADYVGVEARIAPWFCGQMDKLKSILDGIDQYKLMASEVVYNIPYEEVTREQRTVGKPVELQLGYGAGGKGLRNSLRDLHGVHLTLKECNAIVAKFRTRFPKYEECWKEIEEAVKTVIGKPSVGEIAIAGGKVTFRCGRTAGIDFLVMKLPSGRKIYYPEPKVSPVFKKYDEEDLADDPTGEKRARGGYWIDSISFFGQHERVWRRIHTWGSRLFENICQGIGADLMHYGMICAEQEGYGVMMCIHDQALAQANGGTLEGFIEALCRKEPWAESFPLEADGQIVPFYLKEN